MTILQELRHSRIPNTATPRGRLVSVLASLPKSDKKKKRKKLFFYYSAPRVGNAGVTGGGVRRDLVVS